MFSLKVIRYVEASHGLRNFKGADEPIHPHTWRIEVEAASKQVDASGCCIDFHEVDRTIDEVMEPFRGKNFNDLPPFDRLSPSAENIAKFLFTTLSEKLNSDEARITRVSACEDDHHRASYGE